MIIFQSECQVVMRKEVAISYLSFLPLKQSLCRIFEPLAVFHKISVSAQKWLLLLGFKKSTEWRIYMSALLVKNGLHMYRIMGIPILASQRCRGFKCILVKNFVPQVVEALEVPSVLWE